MTQRLPKVLLMVMTLATKATIAQDPLTQCTAQAGGPGKEAFLTFDRELRAALSTQDAASLALLVDFPLRVNPPDRATISLDNQAALQVRFQEVFSPAVRKAVLNQKTEEVFCKYTGIMYGRGELWIQAIGQGNVEHSAVKTVNLPSSGKKAWSESWSLKAPRVEFACNTERDRLIIDANKDGTVRYRAWNKPRSISDKPDIEVPSGTERVEGTDPCTHAMWTFRHSNTEFVVSELGCNEVNSVPAGATGEHVVSVDGKQEQRWWCY